MSTDLRRSKRRRIERGYREETEAPELPELGPVIEGLLAEVNDEERTAMQLPPAFPAWKEGHQSGDFPLLVNPDERPTVLREMPRTSEAFERLRTQFAAESLSVHRVIQVMAPGARIRYEATRGADARIRVAPGAERMLWHTPSNRAVAQVVAEGCLDPRVSRGGRFGRGAYTTPDILKAAAYAKTGTEKLVSPYPGPTPPPDLRIMLQVAINTGRVFECPKGTINYSLQRPPSGFDSVCGNITGSDEIVVYDRTRTLVHYIVEYLVSPNTDPKP